MKTLLDTIIDQKKREIEALKRNFSYKDFEQAEAFHRTAHSLVEVLKKPSFSVIAEIKRKSPSAGTINAGLDVTTQGKLYEEADVAGISCLTDAPFFGGSPKDLIELRKVVTTPILRKEFIIDELQLFESKAMGADAVLLISEVLDTETALHLTIMAQQLGMEVIMECHDRAHLNKINDQVDIIGINNRNLHLQQTTLSTSEELFPFIPQGRICISESGIKTRTDLLKLAAIGYHGALIGESILTQRNPKDFIESLTVKSDLCS